MIPSALAGTAALLTLVALTLDSTPSFAADGDAPADGKTGIKLSTGPQFTTGTYGTNERTNIFYLPFSFKYETDPWTFRLTVPYIRIAGIGTVVGGETPVVVNKPGARTRTVNSGLGDVIGGVGYAVVPESAAAPLVELTGKVKFPTASDSKGLGTGEYDYMSEVEVSKTFGRVTPFATLGYRVVGDPAGTELDNVFYGSLGADLRLTGTLSAGLVVDYSQATSSATREPFELAPYLAWKMGRSWSGNAHALIGLSDGSPDFGGGFQITYSP